MILLNVDDDAEDREIFVAAIQEIDSSIKCLVASDGIEAQLLLADEITNSEPDYIFLDINMPKMDGITLLTALKKNKRLNRIPVYMLSTTGNENEIASINALGAKYIQKQSEFKKIVTMLSSILLPQHNNFT